MNCELALELIKEDVGISSVIGKNKHDNRKAFAAAPILLLMMPFAVGFLWYGVGVVGPTIYMMPATGLAPSSSNFIGYVAAFGHLPGAQDWLAILIAAGVSPPLAYAVTWVLVYFGVWGADALASLLTPFGIGAILIVAITAA
ncbi:MAG: hypothetical protein ACTSR9_15900 [Candidatus Thorarchaeota archaeon]